MAVMVVAAKIWWENKESGPRDSTSVVEVSEIGDPSSKKSKIWYKNKESNCPPPFEGVWGGHT